MLITYSFYTLAKFIFCTSYIYQTGPWFSIKTLSVQYRKSHCGEKKILRPSYLVFGLGRIFRLERSAIFMTEFWARLELGAINFHLKPCMFTWAKIGSPFEVIILALYSNVASYHLISTRFLITTSFMISIKWPVDYPIYTNFNEPSHLPCPTSNIGLRTSRQCLPPCGG